MSRQQPEKRGKVDLRLKRKQDNTFRARDVSHNNSEVASTSKRPPLPRLPASRFVAAVKRSEDEPKAEEKRTLLEILAEQEERKKRNMIWTRLPPPNVELYTRKPVVLLNWDDLDNVTPEETVANSSPSGLEGLKEEATVDVYSIPNDDSFSNLIQLAATLESVERQFAPTSLSLQDRAELHEFDNACEVSHSASLVGEGRYIPTPPDFNDDDDNDEYGIGSDMDLFGDEEMDCLYDNVDQQLQKEKFDPVGNSPNDSTLSISGQSSSKVISLDAISPIVVEVQPFSRMASDIDVNVRAAVQGRMRQPPSPVSSTPLSSAGGSSNFQTPMSGKEETFKGTSEGYSTNSLPSIVDISTPQLSAATIRARSYSSESKLSPDSDDLELPPVDWQWEPSQTEEVTQSRVRDEPKPHCSKNAEQAPPTSPPTCSPQPFMKNCPICTMSFPRGYTQLQVDEHVAVCLSAMDWEYDFN